MANKLELFSTVKNGKLQANITRSILKALEGLEGKRVVITINKVKKTRSNQQNRFYWGCVIEIQQQCFLERWGEIFSVEQTHDWNKNNIWHTEKVIEETGEVVKIPGTSVVTTVEFEERLEKLRQFFWLNFEWKVPLPNEELTIDFEDEE